MVVLFFSQNSFNNHYGVPLSVSNLKEKNDFGVFELGMSKKGEINSLSKILKPDIAIITNISLAHSENFKNLKDIANAKAEIINNIKPHGTLLLNRMINITIILQEEHRRKIFKLNLLG